MFSLSSEPRIEVALEILRDIGLEAEVYVDLGCSNGSLTLEIAKIVRARKVYGIDIDEKALEEATKRGIRVFKCDLSKDHIPLPNESTD